MVETRSSEIRSSENRSSGTQSLRSASGLAPGGRPSAPARTAPLAVRSTAVDPSPTPPARRGAPLGRRECTVERSRSAHPSVQAAERAAARRHRRVMRARRSAFVGVVAVLLATCAVWVQGGGGRTGSGPLAAPGAGRTEAVAARLWVVQPGDTLWGIAHHLQPTGDIRPLVDALSREVHGRALQVGQELQLP